MKVLVTGAAGFIGANLVRKLLSLGHDVVGLDDLSTGSRENVEAGSTLVVGSILESHTLAQLCADSDAVVHLAARPSVPRSVADPMMTNEINVTGTLNVLRAARDAGSLYTIVASSSSVYGRNPRLPKVEDLRCEPVSPYAVSKLATESYAEAFRATYDMPTLSFRFFNVFGPLQSAGHSYAAVIPQFIDAALRGNALPVHGDGTQTRDFTFVGTVVNAICSALDTTLVTDGPVNLALGNRVSLLHVADIISQSLGRKLDLDFLSSRAGDVAHSQADSTKLRRLLPDLAAPSFENSLRETVEWYKNCLAV